MSKPTAAQLAALNLATVDAIRYYKGGWYSTPEIAGSDQHRPRYAFKVPAVPPMTLRACVKRGWMTTSSDDAVAYPPTVYSQRWTITDAGRAELARARKEGTE